MRVFAIEPPKNVDFHQQTVDFFQHFTFLKT